MTAGPPERGVPEGEGLHYYRAGRKIPLRRVPAEESARARGGPCVYVQEGDDPDCVLIPTGQVVVQFGPEVAPERVAEELDARGARIVRRLSYLPNGFLAETEPEAALELANELHEQPFVTAAEPNWRRRTRKR